MEMTGGDPGSGSGSGYSWAELSSTLMSMLFVWSMVQQYLPFSLNDLLAPITRRLLAFVNPYVTVTIDEHASEYFGRRSEAYLSAEAYLGEKFGGRASRLRAEPVDLGSDRVSLALDDHEEVADHFRGAKERRSYPLTFHRRHRGLVETAYLPHVLAEGRVVAERKRQRSLFTNGAGSEDGWTHVKMDHPSTFATLAMDPEKKQQIIEDLEMFRDGKEYYASVGKAWKRGYLLYGPPGTGKSTMIAAMANFLDYDVYDLELTAVKSNTELRRLFIETTGRSIIVIEDIDCSVDLTGKRSRKKQGKKLRNKRPNRDDDDDGKKKLDPALIRRGRMDMHIEMSYCSFEGFNVLAKNYLGVTNHELFGKIRRLLEEVDISPADVAENLMTRSKKKDVDTILENLAKVLEQAKEAALAKASLAKDKKDNDQEESDDDDSIDNEGDEVSHFNESEEMEDDYKKKNKKSLFRVLAKVFTCN
ncbi:hypothetical protein PR202_gn00831 [Eleusine coracana subsp. coracana]|uniref:AAA+ ATPase domain-containing protein n=1 Tax=Eleusine coracana subsp. coracana TaxID=191504 RepID=A0AAV5G0T0_ELECO|nr:hypothetical protein PR202_gn00831 [Eleusine coracana subsp. coracana]